MTPDRLWLAWSFDPGVVIPLLLSGILYARGQRIRVTATPARRLVFWTGWITLTLSLLSPCMNSEKLSSRPTCSSMKR